MAVQPTESARSMDMAHPPEVETWAPSRGGEGLDTDKEFGGSEHEDTMPELTAADILTARAAKSPPRPVFSCAKASGAFFIILT